MSFDIDENKRINIVNRPGKKTTFFLTSVTLAFRLVFCHNQYSDMSKDEESSHQRKNDWIGEKVFLCHLRLGIFNEIIIYLLARVSKRLPMFDYVIEKKKKRTFVSIIYK